jgi:hypothetical protein
VYDCSRHAELVLEAISSEGFDFNVMLGVDMRAEVSNPNCSWGANFIEQMLVENHQANCDEIDHMTELAKRYPDVVFSVSVGKEAAVAVDSRVTRCASSATCLLSSFRPSIRHSSISKARAATSSTGTVTVVNLGVTWLAR